MARTNVLGTFVYVSSEISAHIVAHAGLALGNSSWP